MAARKTNAAPAALADRLQAWAETYGHTQDPYIVELYADLKAGKALDYWSSIEPLEYLPNLDFMRRSNALKVARFLAGFRNIIIFVPVAITWAAVSEATTAFNTFVQQNTGTPANFLQFWQDGYGILDTFWSIGNIAKLDFVIVAAVIAMTAAVAWLQSRGQSEATRRGWGFAQGRRALALDIKRVLFTYRPVVSGNVPVEVAKSVRELRSALNGATEVDRPFKKIAQTTDAVAKDIQAANRSLKTDLNNLQKQISAAAKKLGK